MNGRPTWPCHIHLKYRRDNRLSGETFKRDRAGGKLIGGWRDAKRVRDGALGFYGDSEATLGAQRISEVISPPPGTSYEGLPLGMAVPFVQELGATASQTLDIPGPSSFVGGSSTPPASNHRDRAHPKLVRLGRRIERVDVLPWVHQRKDKWGSWNNGSVDSIPHPWRPAERRNVDRAVPIVGAI